VSPGAVHGTAWELEKVRGNVTLAMLTLAIISVVASLGVFGKDRLVFCRESSSGHPFPFLAFKLEAVISRTRAVVYLRGAVLIVHSILLLVCSTVRFLRTTVMSHIRTTIIDQSVFRLFIWDDKIKDHKRKMIIFFTPRIVCWDGPKITGH
jgi:hypothetical protein